MSWTESPASVSPRQRGIAACMALLAFAIPSLAGCNYVLNHFYGEGAYLLDSGWFAWMSTQADRWPLPNPPHLGDTYFATHVSLIFYVLTGLHRLVSPLAEIDSVLWFALVQGAWAGLTSLAVHTLLDKGKAGPRWEATRLVLAISAALNGIALAIVAFPHMEAAIPALTLCFFALLLRGRPLLASAVLLLALSVREDVGLHLFGLLILTAAACWLRSRQGAGQGWSWRGYAACALFCLAWSIAVIVWQKSGYPGDNALVRIYLGEPAYAHLDAGFLLQRLGQLAAASLHVLLPIALLLLLGCATRNVVLLAGPLSVLPWIVFSVLAVSEMAGSLANYYAFPVMTAILWPAVVHAMENTGLPRASRRQPLWLAAAVALSLVGFVFASHHFHDPAPWRAFGFDWRGERQATETALDALSRLPAGELGDARFDDGATALRPDLVPPGKWLYAETFSDIHAGTADTLIHMPRGDYPLARQLMEKHGYAHACRYEDSHLVVRSKRELALPGCRAFPLP